MAVSGLAANASASAPSGSGEGGECACSVSVTPTLYPITIQLTGPVKDPSGNWDILIGQHCSAQLVGIPTGGGWSAAYQWSVTGTTFQYWSSDTPANGNNPYNPDASYYVDGPGPLTNPTAGWYWDDLHPTTETVSCTVTLTPPAGEGSPFSLSLSQPVTVYVPAWAATGDGGYVKAALFPNTTNYEIYAGPTAVQLANGEKGGMNFEATVLSPAPALFGNGSLELVQLVTTNMSYTTSTDKEYTYSQNGQEGLDSGYPYGWEVETPTYKTWDLPGFGLEDYLVTTATLDIQFEDYLMCFAPGSPQCVPVAHFIWDTDGYAVLPTTGTWSSYASQHGGSDAAGSVTPSSDFATFLPDNEFPMWTQINGGGTFGFTAPIQGASFRRRRK